MSPRTNLLLLNAAFLRPQVGFMEFCVPPLLVSHIKASTAFPTRIPNWPRRSSPTASSSHGLSAVACTTTYRLAA